MHPILVRHGRPEIIVDSPTVADPSLDEIGRWQAERLTAWLACEDGPTDPYCSVASANKVALFDVECTVVVGAFRGAERPETTFNHRPLSAPAS